MLYGNSRSGFRPEVYPAVRSVDFDGVDSYLALNTGSATTIKFNDTTHAISFWFKSGDTAGITHSALFAYTHTTDSHVRYWLSLTSAGALHLFGWGDGSDFPITAGGVTCSSVGLDDDAWHHVLLSYNGSDEVNVYVDGGSATTVAVGAGDLEPNRATVGARLVGSTLSYPWAGSSADFSVHAREPDAGQRARLATKPILDYRGMGPMCWLWCGDKDTSSAVRDHGLAGGTVAFMNGVSGDFKDGAPS